MNLIINSSPKQEHSIGVILAERLVKRLPGAVKTISIYESDQKYFNFKFNQEWIDLVKAAGCIIIPVAMWNLTIPAALKDFLDKIVKRKEMWDLDDCNHYIGLLADRPVYVIMTSSAEYGPQSPDDFVIPYLKDVLNSIGIHSVYEFRVENIFDSGKMSKDAEFLQQQTQAMLKAFGL